MTESIRIEVQKIYESLSKSEKARYEREASRERQMSRKKPRVRHRVRADEEDDFDDRLIHTDKPIREIIFEIIARELEQAAHHLRGESRGEGTVVELTLDRCWVQVGGHRVMAMLTHSLMTHAGGLPAIGDHVFLVERGGQTIVSSIAPRRTMLSRPDPAIPGKALVFAANVDRVVVVTSVVAPPLHPRIIDRFLVAIAHGGAEAMIVVNKVDLLDDSPDREAELALLRPYRSLGIPLVLVSAASPQRTGIDQLAEQLAGQTCVFAGHSGVGKSSTINALVPELELLTGDVSAGYGRGTHTTTRSVMVDGPHGMKLIDTPGIRALGLPPIAKDELARSFPEFQNISQDCKYRDCTHSHEPKCAVQRAVARGHIPRERYETYLGLMEEIGS